VTPLGQPASPTALVLTSGTYLGEKAKKRTQAALVSLGYEVLHVRGLNYETGVPPPVEAVTNLDNKAHLAYHLCFIPKLLKLTEGLRDCDHVVVVEDSVWLTTAATPAAVLDEVRKAGQSCWLGYCNTPTRNNVPRMVEGILSSREKTRAKVPYGLKLLALSRPFLLSLQQLMLQTELGWFADQHFKVLVGAKQLTVVSPAYAACAPHYSLVSNQWKDALKPRRLQGELLVLEDMPSPPSSPAHLQRAPRPRQPRHSADSKAPPQRLWEDMPAAVPTPKPAPALSAHWVWEDTAVCLQFRTRINIVLAW
jgi:hypothetical protein